MCKYEGRISANLANDGEGPTLMAKYYNINYIIGGKIQMGGFFWGGSITTTCYSFHQSSDRKTTVTSISGFARTTKLNIIERTAAAFEGFLHCASMYFLTRRTIAQKASLMESNSPSNPHTHHIWVCYDIRELKKGRSI
jgi:hypothetical protein